MLRILIFGLQESTYAFRSSDVSSVSVRRFVGGNNRRKMEKELWPAWKRNCNWLTTEFITQIEIPIDWISFYFLIAIKKELISRIERIRWPCLTENKTTAPMQCLTTHPPSHATFVQIVDETEPAPRNNVFRVNQKELGRASPQRTLVNGVGKVPFVEYRVSPANQSTLFDLADTRRIRPGE